MLSLYAKGLTTGELSAHFAEIYGASVSRETVSRITEKVVVEMQEWATPPLDAVYVAVFIDAIMVKVRDGQVANRPVYAAIGVTTEGCKDVLGLWPGTGGEGARFWMKVRSDSAAEQRPATGAIIWQDCRQACGIGGVQLALGGGPTGVASPPDPLQPGAHGAGGSCGVSDLTVGGVLSGLVSLANARRVLATDW